MNQLAARELINNGWFFTSFCLTIIFVVFLVQEMREAGWYAKLKNKAALALVIYFFGETLARGWSVLLLYKLSNGTDLISTFAVEERFPVALVGACVSFLGAICCVRVFSPPSWGHRGWLTVAAGAAAFMLVTYLY